MDEIEIGANRSRSVWVQEGVFGVQPSLSLCQFSLVPFFFFFLPSIVTRMSDNRWISICLVPWSHRAEGIVQSIGC